MMTNYIIFSLLALYVIRVIYWTRRPLKRIRVVEHVDGSFLIEKKRILLWGWSSRLAFHNDGDIRINFEHRTWDFIDKESAIEKVNQYVNYCASQGSSATRKRVVYKPMTSKEHRRLLKAERQEVEADVLKKMIKAANEGNHSLEEVLAEKLTTLAEN